MIDYLLRLPRACGAATTAAARLCFARGHERPLALREPAPGGRAPGARSGRARRRRATPRPATCSGNVLYGFGRRDEALAHWREAARLDAELAPRVAQHRLRRAPAALGRPRRRPGVPQRVRRRPDRRPRAARARPGGGAPARAGAASGSRGSTSHRTVMDSRDDLVTRWIDLKLQVGTRAATSTVARARAAHAPLPQLGRRLRHPPERSWK